MGDMKKLTKLLALLSAFFLLFSSFSLAASEEVNKKYHQLSPVVNILLSDGNYKATVEAIIRGCAKTNKNEALKGACQLIVDEWEGNGTAVEAKKNLTYKLVSIVDGDTIKIQRDGKTLSVRMIGIDAPESTVTRYGYVEDFGKEATAYLTKLLAGVSEVEIELDASQGEYDRYNRLLAYVFVDGKNINQKMLEEGYAVEYTYNKPYKYQQAFKSASSSAES